MTKTHWLALALLVILGAGGYFYYDNKDDIGDSSMDDDSEESMETDDRKMSFGDFVRQGGSYRCDIEQTTEGATTKGIAYINDGMIKGEYVTQTKGLSMTSYVIVRDGYAYTWTSFVPNMGFKARIVETESTNTPTDDASPSSFNADDVADYDCEMWAADASVFALPTGVKFSEINK